MLDKRLFLYPGYRIFVSRLFDLVENPDKYPLIETANDKRRFPVGG